MRIENFRSLLKKYNAVSYILSMWVIVGIALFNPQLLRNFIPKRKQNTVDFYEIELLS